jgi:hypothetical protein
MKEKKKKEMRWMKWDDGNDDDSDNDNDDDEKGMTHSFSFPLFSPIAHFPFTQRTNQPTFAI